MPQFTRVAIDPVVVSTPVYDTAVTLTEDGYPMMVRPPVFHQRLSDAEVLRKRAMTFGIGAIVLGTLANATIAGLAFRSYKATGSVVRPAVIIGVGGLAVSAVTAFLLVRGLRDSTIPALLPDNRSIAAGAGLLLVG